MVVGLPQSFSPFWGCLPVPVLTAGGGRVLGEAIMVPELMELTA